MRHDIRLTYERLLNDSHEGHPSVVQHIPTQSRGRPKIFIDPEFLKFAYQHRTTSGIARFLGVSKTVVRNALLENGIALPGQNPFPVRAASNQAAALDTDVDFFDPQVPVMQDERLSTQISSNISDINDATLDSLIIQLRVHYRRAGVTMLEGMLRRLGHQIPRERIQLALLRIDPIRRVFERIRIRRRVYTVPGPNALWHHDGQHGTRC